MQWYPVQEETKTVVLSHGCQLDHMQGITSIEFRSGFAVGESSHCRAESVQPRIALSGAKLYAGMRGISDTLGVVYMMREQKTNDWGRIVQCVDASACRTIMLTRGCGGRKQVTVKSLWVQEAVHE